MGPMSLPLETQALDNDLLTSAFSSRPELLGKPQVAVQMLGSARHEIVRSPFGKRSKRLVDRSHAGPPSRR